MVNTMERTFICLERGNRLKTERKRFEGLTQKAAAEIAGIKEQSWVRFEKRGEPFDLKVVEMLEDYGFDMMYVIFGIPKVLKPEQIQLLGLFDGVEETKKQKIIQMVELMVEPS